MCGTWPFSSGFRADFVSGGPFLGHCVVGDAVVGAWAWGAVLGKRGLAAHHRVFWAFYRGGTDRVGTWAWSVQGVRQRGPFGGTDLGGGRGKKSRFQVVGTWTWVGCYQEVTSRTCTDAVVWRGFEFSQAGVVGPWARVLVCGFLYCTTWNRPCWG